MAPGSAGWSGSGNGGLALNALAAVMLVMSLVVAGLGCAGYRIMSCRRRVAVPGRHVLSASAGHD